MPALIDHVVDFLQSRYPQPNPFWQRSRNNTLGTGWLLNTPSQVWGRAYADFKQQVAGAYPDFELATCSVETTPDSPGPVLCAPVRSTARRFGDAAVDLSVGHSHQLYETVYETMLSAKVLLDVTTLTPPTGQCLAAFRNAITAISTKPEAERPVIRILYSNPLPNVPRQDAAVFLKDITRDVAPDAKMRIYVVVAYLSNTSWNHAKIVAADGEQALTGGHNLWGPDYLGKFPVFDVSMRISGDAAVHAHDYADYVWSLVPDRGGAQPAPWWSVTLQASCVYSDFTRRNEYGTSLPPAGIYASLKSRFVKPSPAGSVDVLAIGRHAHAEWSEDRVPNPIPYYNSLPAPEAADDALIKLCDLAQSSIKLSQQSLYFLGVNSKQVMDALTRALMRQVPVSIVVSNPLAIAGGQWIWEAPYPGPKLSKVYRDFFKSLKAAGLTDAQAKQRLDEKLQVAYVRYSQEDAYPDKPLAKPIPNHAKILMVDDTAFYIGSENLYASDLNEFGYIVEDADAVRTFLAQYWTPLWRYSSRTVDTGFSDADALDEQTEAMQFVIALRKNRRLNEVWADTIASRKKDNPDDAYKAQTAAILEDVISSAGFSARAGVVAATMQLPFFQDSGATPNDASDKFVAALATQPALLTGFVQALNAPYDTPSQADGALASFLKGKGYDCTGRQVNASLEKLRRHSLSFWTGFYADSWLRADGGTYFETCRPRGNGVAQAPPPALRDAPAEQSAPIAVPGPSFSIFGNTDAALAKDRIIKPAFADGVLTWSADSSELLTNATSGWVVFSEITRPTPSDPFTGLECFGAITYPDDGTPPLKGKVSFYARKTSDTPPDIPPRVDPDSVNKQSNYVGWIIGAAVAGAALIGVGAYLGFRSRSSPDDAGWRKKTDAETPDDPMELQPLNQAEPTGVSLADESLAAGQISPAQRESLAEQSTQEMEENSEASDKQFEEDNRGVEEDVPEGEFI